MSSLLPDVPPSIRSPISSPARPKHTRTHSTADTIASTKQNWPLTHRNHGKPRDGDKMRERDRDRDRDETNTPLPNPALQLTAPLTGVETGAGRSESATPAPSQTPSRRTSLIGPNLDVDSAAPNWKAEGKCAKEVELGEEMERGVLRASELQNELGDLNSLGNYTIRRLDNTYYSVLEKLGVLQNTIVSLKELAKMTRLLNEEFETEAKKIATEVEASLNGFHGFEAQQKQIEDLTGRVEAGREKVKALGARVDLARNRVEGWERAEGEWQDRTRKRLRVLWILMSAGAAICVALSVFHYTPVRTPGLDILSGLNTSEIVDSVPPLERFRSEAWSVKKDIVDTLKNMSNCGTEDELEEDPRLRVFDEL